MEWGTANLSPALAKGSQGGHTMGIVAIYQHHITWAIIQAPQAISQEQEATSSMCHPATSSEGVHSAATQQCRQRAGRVTVHTHTRAQLVHTEGGEGEVGCEVEPIYDLMQAAGQDQAKNGR